MQVSNSISCTCWVDLAYLILKAPVSHVWWGLEGGRSKSMPFFLLPSRGRNFYSSIFILIVFSGKGDITVDLKKKSYLPTFSQTLIFILPMVASPCRPEWILSSLRGSFAALGSTAHCIPGVSSPHPTIHSHIWKGLDPLPEIRLRDPGLHSNLLPLPP